MQHIIFAILSHYHWALSLAAGAGIAVGSIGLNKLLALVPTFKAAQNLNRETFEQKMTRPNYAANQKLNRKWSGTFLVVIFGMILPFCLTARPQAWWSIPLDSVIILMVYDFFYYFTHRFIFHDGGIFGGPLLHMHGVHHRQHNPCRWDASYINPLEIAIGLGLYVFTIFLLSCIMGNFNVLTVVITWVAFTELNLHNHDLWTENRFPFKYLNYAAKLHHFHHIRFTGGNFATISPLYDWMFGTLDHGNGYRALAKSARPAE